MIAKQPAPFSLSEKAEPIPHTIHAPSEQSNHPHHGRSDGLKGTARIVTGIFFRASVRFPRKLKILPV
jgi:hypothetical protein